MSDFSIEFENAAQVQELIWKLPAQYAKAVQVQIIKRSAAPLLSEAKRMAPRAKGPVRIRGNTIPPGTLSRSIGWIDMRKSKNVVEIMGPRAKGAFGGYKGGWFAHFLEFGHKVGRSKSGKFLNVSKTITTGFIAPRPFMAPAWQSKSGMVKQTYEREALNIFERYVNRMRAKGKL